MARPREISPMEEIQRIIMTANTERDAKRAAKFLLMHTRWREPLVDHAIHMGNKLLIKELIRAWHTSGQARHGRPLFTDKILLIPIKKGDLDMLRFLLDLDDEFIQPLDPFFDPATPRVLTQRVLMRALKYAIDNNYVYEARMILQSRRIRDQRLLKDMLINAIRNHNFDIANDFLLAGIQPPRSALMFFIQRDDDEAVDWLVNNIPLEQFDRELFHLDRPTPRRRERLEDILVSDSSFPLITRSDSKSARRYVEHQLVPRYEKNDKRQVELLVRQVNENLRTPFTLFYKMENHIFKVMYDRCPLTRVLRLMARMWLDNPIIREKYTRLFEERYG